VATPTPKRRHPGVTLGAFFTVLALLALGMVLSGVHTPKLGLDLSSGTTITLTARNVTGSGSISADSLEQARSIIEQRVNSLGVGEPEITTAGGNQIDVSVPNVQANELVDMVGTTAQLYFRRVYQVDYVQTATGDTTVATGFPQVPSDVASERPTAATRELPTDETERLALFEELMAWQPTDDETIQSEYDAYVCGDDFPDVWDQPLITCLADEELTDEMKAAGYNQKFLLGPAIIEGARVKEASYGIPTGEVSYIVTLTFDSLGTTLFGKATTELVSQTEPLNRFAIVLDGLIQSAPTTNAAIVGGSARIEGSFTQSTARTLSTVLNYGALPLAFELGNVSSVSPTLGKDQLYAGLVAGAIGLGLVLVYSFLYYRGLGIVVVASLAVAAIAAYTLIVLLGESIGFALSLPGMAGIIVAIGVTADSFIIFFERVRDEAREGRTLRNAVETGWLKARRTIVVADTVSLLSAIILYILSIGAVRGFAFALGLTTAIDLAIIFFCTKPLVSLLVKTKFFGEGRKGSGLEAEHLGVSPTRRPQPRRQPVTAGKEA
jgi:preprotein translocase subunit SecD